ncbi:hypothetical protein PV10_09154 [Exophiala mesophila]|uniref:Cytochrome P450 n=1 Tax=Exophiala mesophila TaxID=212818 RepID=A0A0D1Z247_EXOME|nr:uncharacterized protein PV10_09154 [Exophiala mesophila]KIV87964.1 hypothetical protein PV10_09154 [Exophiala mesophila]
MACFAIAIITKLASYFSTCMSSADSVQLAGGAFGWRHAMGFLKDHQNYIRDLRYPPKFQVGCDKGNSNCDSERDAHGIHRLQVFTASLVLVTSPVFAQPLLVDFRLPLSTRDMMLHLLEKVWNEKGELRRSGITEKRLHRDLSALMGQKFMLHASSVINDELAREIFIPKTSGKISSDMKSIASGSERDVEIRLFSFLRRLVGNIAVRAIMGLAFTTNNPNFVDNLWEIDANVKLLLLGLEKLPLPTARAVRKARDEVVRATLEHHKALLVGDQGERSTFGDLSDVSDICKTLLQGWAELGISTESCASTTSAILWAANINTAPIVYWMIRHLFQHRNVLCQIRSEVEPYVQHSSDQDPQIRVDIEALTSRCSLLRAVFLETLRMEAHTFSLKMVTEDCTVFPYQARGGAEQFPLKKGEIVCVAHGAHQMDPEYFPESCDFNPLRYEERTAGGKTDHPRTSYGDMFVFSGGKALCKGRAFAHAEVLAVVAAFVISWEIAPMDETPQWRKTDRVSTSGAYLPMEDLKVRLQRRIAWGECRH